ncbi:unnamed protein product [Echinostoma caproni]|uniref:Rab5-interacting protein n=1 Tax=Echinostoma caproni TaxID=27848 RepID=A0A183AYW1_9TREM|nr:unnamed protein product [Echinostoma caproni]
MTNSKNRSWSFASNPYYQTFLKTFTPESVFDDKNEFLDIVYWLRQVLAILTGILWGLIPLKGLTAILLFFLMNMGAIYIYAALFQRVDEEEYGGFGEIVKEGLMTAFSCFMVSWIVLFDYMHTGNT